MELCAPHSECLCCRVWLDLFAAVYFTETILSFNLLACAQANRLKKTYCLHDFCSQSTMQEALGFVFLVTGSFSSEQVGNPLEANMYQTI